MIAGIGIMLLTFVAMEAVAWAMHKYVLHGFLWSLHRSHHVPHQHKFERNDFFFAFYGTLAMLCFIFGYGSLRYLFWVGAGISLYGLAYFVIHDIFIHRRIRLFRKTANVYLKALNIAHKVHHKTQGKAGSQSFGMLWVAPKYFKLANQSVQKRKKRGSVHY